MKKQKLLAAILSFSILFSFGAILVHAAPDCAQNSGLTDCKQNTAPGSNITVTIGNPLAGGANNLPAFFTLVLQNIVMPLAGVLCVLAFVYAGFKFVTAGGDTTKIKEARAALLWVAVGTAILLGATGILAVLNGTIKEITTSI